MRQLCRRALALLMLPLPLWAAEGLWTLDKLPREALREQYGFEPDAAWVEHVMKASLRLANGCSGSFVSGQGLVMTNAHCVLACAQGLSDWHDYVNRGFLARRPSEALRCPALELNQLEQVRDVSAQMQQAVNGKSGQDYIEARRAAQAQLESSCVGNQVQTQRCEVVELYGGSVYQLHRYHRYQDVRLVFFPEYQAAFFGGDADNFNFPRYSLDLSLLRAYENGKPVQSADYFPVQAQGAKPGELTLVIGNPGSTERQLTVTQLETLRDFSLLQTLLYFAERRAMLAQYSRSGDSAAHYAQADLSFTENSLKVFRGELQTLSEGQLFARKRAEEAVLRAAAGNSSAWDEIARAEEVRRRLYQPFQMLENRRAFFSNYFKIARDLLRGSAERERPNEQRLPEYQDAALPALEQQLFSSAPLRDAYEQATLTWSLDKLREALGADDPLVKQVLRGQSPDALAAQLLRKTRLGSVAERRRLWRGGTAAILASDDPFIQLARAVDAPSRELREQYESQVEGPQARAAQRIAQLRFARFGAGGYPEASFSPRLSFGEIRGWSENGKAVPPLTNLAGAFVRQTGFLPFVLPDTWNRAKSALELETTFNFVSDHDVVGGNSGSPVINRQGQLVGLVFDGNIHSTGGSYYFDEQQNRAVAVHPAAILEVLDKVYAAPALKAELLGEFSP